MLNKFTKQILLKDVLDEKQSFKLKNRNDSPEYNVQRKEGKMVVFTSKKSGKTFSRSGKTKVFVKGK